MWSFGWTSKNGEWWLPGNRPTSSVEVGVQRHCVFSANKTCRHVKEKKISRRDVQINSPARFEASRHKKAWFRGRARQYSPVIAG
jgi:hypothetical protein